MKIPSFTNFMAKHLRQHVKLHFLIEIFSESSAVDGVGAFGLPMGKSRLSVLTLFDGHFITLINGS
jgi:hypothetical protein